MTGKKGYFPQPLLRLAYRARHLYWRIVRPVRRGVKIMAFTDQGSLLLVRHSYGRSDLWMLPGGGIARGELPQHAAARELMEETSLVASEVRLFGLYTSQSEGKRDHVALFVASVAGVPVIDAAEIAEARFFDPAHLPGNLSPATARRIEEWQGVSERSQFW